jgi:hypothetical protein
MVGVLWGLYSTHINKIKNKKQKKIKKNFENKKFLLIFAPLLGFNK